MFYYICVDLQTIWKWNIKFMLQLHWWRSSDYHSKGEANLFLIELSCFCQASGSSRPPLMGFPPRPSTCRWEGERSLNTHQMVLKNRAVCLKRKYQNHCLFFRSGREKKPPSHQSWAKILWCSKVLNSTQKKMWGKLCWWMIPFFLSLRNLDLNKPSLQDTIFQC